MAESWKLKTVATAIGCCHKIDEFPSSGAYKTTSAYIYDDGHDANHPDPVLLAKARLIAAAPDLLAACNALVAWYESDDTVDVDIENMKRGIKLAKAAIAKAEGK